MLRNKVGVWALAAGAATSWTASALADSVVVLDNYEIQRNYDRDSDEEPQTISLRDCEANFDVSYPTNVTVTSGSRQLDVWAGPVSCIDPDRLDDEEKCRNVFSTQVTANNPNIVIPAQDIVNNGGEDCDSAKSGPGNATSVLLFAFEGNNGEPESEGSFELNMSYDTVPPDPPRATSLGQGDGQLSPHWEPLEDVDVTGYRFYCQESSTTQEQVDAGNFDEAGAGGQGGADSTGCETDLVAGERPPETATFCGEQAGKSAGRGTADGLVNDRVYAVGVVSQDIVGNEGVVSNVLCQYPKEVTDFYEAYTAAGGKGGGGFCSIGYGREASPWFGLTLLGLALGWARRRRRHP
ncbi:MAG TPA: hypothetical protein VFU02_03155 [Polyangiaceae bacterium]|nr:hypothetical protein [Polyangiaceae bacterium]